MATKQEFLNFINNKTCNKFSFIRLKQVFFDATKNCCLIQFIYPSEKELTDEDKKEIENAVREYITAPCSVNVRINKSFVEVPLILGQVKNFLANNNPVVAQALSDDDFEISLLFPVEIIIKMEQSLIDYFEKNDVARRLENDLKQNFCTEFDIKTKVVQKENDSEQMLADRLQAIKLKSDLDSLVAQSHDKYFVKNKRVIVGKEITSSARYINTVKREYESCVLGGKICFLAEKTFKRKNPKANKEGEEEFIEKPRFTFQLKDETGSMNCVVFPSKEAYHKMHLLSNGNTVVVEGKIQKWNGSFDMVVKKISLCDLPDKNEVVTIASQDEIVDYRYVRPQKYTSERQTSLFFERKLSEQVERGKFVVYDLETTGVDPAKDEIIEIGALKIENGEFSEFWTTLVKPSRPIPPDATKVNRITNDMVAHCYNISQIISDFYLFCKDCTIVGYNSNAFDNLFLQKAGNNSKITFDNPVLDVFLMAKQKLKGLKNYKLGTVAKYLDVNLIDAHRALNDVIATAEVFLKLY